MKRRYPIIKKIPLAVRRRRIVVSRLLAGTLMVSSLILATQWILTRPNYLIKKVVIEGIKSISGQEMRSLVSDKLDGSYLGIIPRSSIIFYPREKIAGVLGDYFRSLESAAIYIGRDKSLVISVEERTPQFIWCRETGSVPAEQCFFMDRGGYIFDEAGGESLESYIRFDGFINGIDNPIGRFYISSERFADISSFLGELARIGLHPKNFLVNDSGEYVINLKSDTYLLVSNDADFEDVLSNINSVRNDPDLKKLFIEDILPFEYIDLRLNKKIYYKLRT